MAIGTEERLRLLNVNRYFVSYELDSGELQSCSARNREASWRDDSEEHLTPADSGLQLDLEIALSGNSSEDPPHGQISPAEVR